MITVLISVISIVFGIGAVWPVFLAGILVDLVNINLLGSHSLFFLIVLWLTRRYQRKIHIGAVMYPMVFFFCVMIAEELIFRRTISYITVISGTVIGIVLIAILSRIFPEKVSDKKRLSV